MDVVAATERERIEQSLREMPFYVQALRSNDTVFTTNDLAKGSTMFAYSRTLSSGSGPIGVIVVAVDLRKFESSWAGFNDAQRRALLDDGQVQLPSDYTEAPYIIPRHLIEEGRTRLVLRDPLPLPFPVRLLHGTADADVEMGVALRLLDHADSPDMRLTLVKDADHRFSDGACLGLIEAAIEEVIALHAAM